MTRQEEKNKARFEYVSKRLANPDFPTYNAEYELESAFDEGVVWADEHPHWISVEDELPPMRNEDGMSDKVLTHSKGGIIYMNRYDYWGNTWGNPLAFNVTHWMPMPAPPHHIIDANKKVDRVIGTADHIKTALNVLNKKGGENENS